MGGSSLGQARKVLVEFGGSGSSVREMCLEGCGWGWMGVWMEVWCPCASVVALWAVACAAACRVFVRVLCTP